jgi:ABC-2 type transport system permease protein
VEWLGLYGTYVRMFLRSRKEYRASFFAGILANFFCYFISYATYWLVTESFTSIGGWSYPELTVLYTLNQMTYAISGTMFGYSIYNLEQYVTRGGLDRYLVRPVGLIPQLMCEGFGYTFLGQIAVCLVFLLTQLPRLSVVFTIWKALYLVVAIAGGVLLQAAGMITVGALSLWILRSTDVGWIGYHGVRTFVAYPLSIYPKFVKVVLTFVLPWAFINYYPSVLLLDRFESPVELAFGLAAPVVGAAAFLGSLLLFRRGLSHYTGSGS